MGKVTIYPSDELQQQLEQMAERERRSLNAQIMLILERALAGTTMTFDLTPNTVSGIVQQPSSDPPATKSNSVQGKVRKYQCEHRVPAGAYCKVCDKED